MGDIEVETTRIGINIMNYGTRLADYEMSELEQNVNIFAPILRKFYKLYYQKVKLMQYKKTKQNNMTTFNRIYKQPWEVKDSQ